MNSTYEKAMERGLYGTLLGIVRRGQADALAGDYEGLALSRHRLIGWHDCAMWGTDDDALLDTIRRCLDWLGAARAYHDGVTYGVDFLEGVAA